MSAKTIRNAVILTFVAVLLFVSSEYMKATNVVDCPTGQHAEYVGGGRTAKGEYLVAYECTK